MDEKIMALIKKVQITETPYWQTYCLVCGEEAVHIYKKGTISTFSVFFLYYTCHPHDVRKQFSPINDAAWKKS